MSVFMLRDMFAYVYIYIYVYVCMHMCTYVFVCMHVYIYSSKCIKINSFNIVKQQNNYRSTTSALQLITNI